ncbi:MAG TPA: S-adenosylmethionine:tRNA ribosyltransferase-isomerase [Jatrophihabitans sp.]|jgi:S-adenosylmethionine:tRNA ribosyltransferase-isomerase
MTVAPATQFRLPDELTATEPAEHRGLSRDGVRLLVGRSDGITHTRFADLDQHLQPGDLVVVNTSATIAAEVEASRTRGEPVVLHVATELDDGSWVIELRTGPDGGRPILTAQPGEILRLSGAVRIRLLEPYLGKRLWRAQVVTSLPFTEYLATNGRPISYGYLDGRWPLSDYQTIFSVEPGSAEMPSAARPFTHELVTRLITKGVALAPILLHAGVSSQEAGEPPQTERFSVSSSTARQVNSVRAAGGRVVAVGTTVTRALESAADPDGVVHEAHGWTTLVLGPSHPVRVVSGLVTGLHNPDASHLLLVESVAGADLAQRAYDAAVAERYLWHEFGDSCLLLP